MMVKKIFVLLIISSQLILSLKSQDYQNTKFGIKQKFGNLYIEIQFYNLSTVRIIKYPADLTLKKKSLSVIAEPELTSYTITQENNNLILKSKNIRVYLNLLTGCISFYDNKNNLLLREKENSTYFINFNDAGRKSYTVSQSFLLDGEEAIYGLGQQQQGKMIQRNIKLKMIQGNTDDYIPFFISIKGYGLFWDNYSPTIFYDTINETFFKSEVGDCIDYYFMYGKNADGVISQMRFLTGSVPMFPL